MAVSDPGARAADRPTRIEDERPADRNRHRRGVVRGLFTLAGLVAAGVLTWLAAKFFTPAASDGEFWIAMAILAAAGLALGLSQLFGGWTKWGAPRLSSGVLLFGWIPAVIACGWILLTIQPSGGWQQGRLAGWSDSIGILGFVDRFADYPGVVALTWGLITAFLLDTSGPRARRIDARERDWAVADEDVHDYRTERGGETVVLDETEHVPAGTAPEERTVLDRPTRRDTP